MKWIAAALVVAGLAAAWLLWPREKAATTPVVVTQAPKRIDVGKRPDPTSRPRAAISGTVRDPAKKPLAGATVCVTQRRAHRCVQTKTDGLYEITGVVAEVFALGASLARYQPEQIEIATIDPDEQRTIDLVLEPGGAEIGGVVEDILGGSIAHAHASADGAHAEADDKGRFTLWVRPRADFVWVTAEADGYGARSQPMKVPGKITIALAPESAIAGRVVDATTGAPVAGARVVTKDVQATSGPDGTFALEGLAAGTYPISASAPGKYGARAQDVAVGVADRIEGIEVRVFPARSVIATLDVKGDRAICEPTPSLADWTFTVPAPWRDDAGRYHFDAVPPSVYTVTLGCNAEVPPLVVGDDDVEVTWHVDTGGVVKGVVRADTTRYLSVGLSRAGSVRRPMYAPALDNTFEFRGVPPGRYTLFAEIDRDTSVVADTIDVANGETLERELVVPPRPRFRLTGKVVDEKLRPVAVGTVKIRSALRPDPAFEAAITNGRFETMLPRDMYNLDARTSNARGYLQTQVEADTDVTITVDEDALEHTRVERFEPREERYTLSGRVVDAQQAPVSGAIVAAVAGFWKHDEEPDLRTTTDAAGKFRIVSTFSQLDLRVYRIGGGTAQALVRADQPAEIVLGAREMITGSAARPDGRIATRFFVRVGDAGSAFTQTFDHTGGRFAIEDKHVYPLRLAAVVNNLEGEPVIVTQDSPKTNVVLKLPKTVDIRGRIVDGTSRAPIPNVRVHGRQSLDGWAPWFIHADQVTDADGRFTMRELPPGPIMLEVLPSLDTWSTQTFHITVPDASGEIEELALARARR